MEETDWRAEYQVCVDHLVYAKIKGVSPGSREMTVEEWVDETLCGRQIGDSPESDRGQIAGHSGSRLQ